MTTTRGRVEDASVRAAGLSDVGRARERNEDASFVGETLFAVADGLGGHRAGEVASGIAVAEIESAQRKAGRAGSDTLLRAVQSANRRVFERAQEEPDLLGMGTTITVVAIDRGVAHLAHVGDSRCYLIRDGAITQVTQDHTLVARMVAEGKLSAEEAEVHPQRSVLTRALGAGPNVDVDTLELQLVAGDRLLLCSDGLTAVMSDDELGSAAASAADMEVTCRELIDEANNRGGPDNITVLLVDVLSAPDGRGTAAPVASSKEPAPQEERRHRRVSVRLLVWLAVVALVVGGSWAALRAWSDRSWYVGFEGTRVAIYHGLPTTIFGIDMSEVEVRTAMTASDVAPFFRLRLEEGIGARSLAHARRIVAQIPRSADGPTPTQTPTPTPTGTASP